MVEKVGFDKNPQILNQTLSQYYSSLQSEKTALSHVYDIKVKSCFQGHVITYVSISLKYNPDLRKRVGCLLLINRFDVWLLQYQEIELGIHNCSSVVL